MGTFINAYVRVKQFFTTDIWLYDSSNAEKHWWDNFQRWLKTFLVALRLIWRKDIFTLKLPALTFATLMAIVPLLAMLFAIAKGFGYDAMIETWLQRVLSSQPAVAETLSGFVKNYLDNTHSGYIIGVGLLMMFYTLLSLMDKIEDAFNDVWRAKKRSLTKRLLEYPSIFFVFGLLIMSASFVNAIEVSVVSGFERYLGWGNVISLLLHPLAIIPMSVFFIFLYCAIPNTFVKIKNTIIPGLLSGTLMIFLQYYYILAQVWLSSYNIIYGSFAALPLFLLWLQCSWGICLFGEVLSYVNQNIHHFDFDVTYEETSHEKKLLYCAVILSNICKQFLDGGKALSPKDIQIRTKLPQQIVNAVIERLLEVGLINELSNDKQGSHEETAHYTPIENVRHLTYGIMIERLEQYGNSKNQDIIRGDNDAWNSILRIRDTYIADSKGIELFDL